VNDLESQRMLLRIKDEVDPNLEMAEIQRRVYSEGGPALYFEKVKGSPFPALSNLFGTMERSRFIFRKTWERTQAAIRIKADPAEAMRTFWKYWHAPITGLTSLPLRSFRAPVLQNETTLDKLPQIKSWPDDGGPYITLPQVYSEDPKKPRIMGSNIGMYRVQMAGNDYLTGKEIGLHYQIHRGIGVHHKSAIDINRPLNVAIFVGGPPAHTVAAVMPLPEGLPEVVFAGMLAGRMFRHQHYKMDGYAPWTISSDADFCILGVIEGRATKPEGPFGDHLGYYSLKHEFPLMKVLKVFHRNDPIWHFTVVGRPPQEDTTFGAMIHDLTKPMVPASIPGVKAMHAVDAAGVHPLLFALGSERYVPYADAGPQEILTQANAILGFNQASLAKYLIIAADGDAPNLNINDEHAFLMHVLERVDWSRDLHFQTKTTMDTLDYSGTGLNMGSKVVIAARGKKKRELSTQLPDQSTLPETIQSPQFAIPGVLVVKGHPFKNHSAAAEDFRAWSSGAKELSEGIPLLIVVDDVEFTCASLKNLLWVTFTRSNPSHDVYGVNSTIDFKHWGCTGSLIIDARIKPHHAPPLVEDESTTKKVDVKWKTWFTKS
jgi:4-hydroxy-3-polyprenylbenzoate decarboxylase